MSKTVTCPECGHEQDELVGASEIGCEECGLTYRVISQTVDMTGGES